MNAGAYVLLFVLLVVLVLGTLQATKVIGPGEHGGFLEKLGGATLFWFAWPLVFLLIGALVPNVATDWGYPTAEFYRVAAEVIALLVIALAFDRGVITGFGRARRAYYALIFVAGEASAFLALSGSLPDSTTADPGGSVGWDGALASVTVTALASAIVLIIGGALGRGDD